MHGVGDAHEVLLGAVMEVALEALPLGVAGRNEPGPRAANLLLDLLPRGHVEPAEEVSKPVVHVADDRRGPVDDEPVAVGCHVLVLHDTGRVAAAESLEVGPRALDVLLGDEQLPERPAKPRGLGDAGCVLERAVDAEQDPGVLHEREEAGGGADDRIAEVPLALELTCLAALLGEVSDDEDELVGPARDEPSLVVARLSLDVERVLDVLEHASRRPPCDRRPAPCRRCPDGRRSWTVRPITSSGDVSRSRAESTLNPR